MPDCFENFKDVWWGIEFADCFLIERYHPIYLDFIFITVHLLSFLSSLISITVYGRKPEEALRGTTRKRYTSHNQWSFYESSLQGTLWRPSQAMAYWERILGPLLKGTPYMDTDKDILTTKLWDWSQCDIESLMLYWTIHGIIGTMAMVLYCAVALKLTDAPLRCHPGTLIHFMY